jgi:hypothetical protein
MAVGEIREALAIATGQQLELTRFTARMTSVWMPLLLPEMLAAHPATEAGPLRTLAEQNFKEPAIEVCVLQIIYQLLASPRSATSSMLMSIEVLACCETLPLPLVATAVWSP